MTTRRITEHLPFGEKRDPRFFGQDILSVSQFDRDDLETIFAVALFLDAEVPVTHFQLGIDRAL